MTTLPPAAPRTAADSPKPSDSSLRKKKPHRHRSAFDISRPSDFDEHSEASEAPTSPAVLSPVRQSTNFTLPFSEDTIYLTNATMTRGALSSPGVIILTYPMLFFHAKQSRPPFLVSIKWEDIFEIGRKSSEKAIQISVEGETITFFMPKEREILCFHLAVVKQAHESAVHTYGFSQNVDDAEVSRRIYVLKAPHVLEEVVAVKFDDVFNLLKEPHVTENMLASCGCTEIIVSAWNKTKNGISRGVQYVQPMAQNCNVSAVQTLTKSGEQCTFEIASSFSRLSSSKFLATITQYYVKADGDKVTFRGAYRLEWANETWDKEFVEATVGRGARMNYYFLKSTFSGEPFNIAKYAGKWRMHQPYVLVIIGLLLLIAGVIALPADADWYKLLAGCIVFAFGVYV
jgi:hypothetical protein